MRGIGWRGPWFLLCAVWFHTGLDKDWMLELGDSPVELKPLHYRDYLLVVRVQSRADSLSAT